MKRFISFMILILLVMPCFAEETEGTQSQKTEQPQIAFRMLNDYVDREQMKADDKTWSYVSLGLGGLLAAGSAVTWFFGDQIAAGAECWTPELKTGLTIGFAGTGALAIGIGLIGLVPIDIRSRFIGIYGEKDPVVQEALAVAALKDLADQGRTSRISRFICGIATPLLSMALQLVINLSAGRSWYDRLEYTVLWQIPAFGVSLTNLFRLSDEERLYEKYRAARSALFGSTPGAGAGAE